MQLIADCRNAAYHLAILFGEEVFGLGMLKEGVFLAGKEQLHIPTQRRDPDRVPRMKPVGQVDELVERPGVANRPDQNGLGQITPSSCPIRPKVSRQ